MATTDQPEEVRHYLRRLDTALSGLPEETASDIRAGIEEELASLNPEAARERIAQLGDPAYIAAEARGETAATTVKRKSGLESRAYVIVTALAVAIGIYVLPIVGALVGYILMWVSAAWKRWEKIVATAIPLVIGLGVATYFVVFRLLNPGGTETPPSVNNLGALYFSPIVMTNALVAVSVANVGVGIWLLIRGLRRT